MKTIKTTVSTLINRFTPALITLLGFSATACDEQEEMYGTPYVTFDVDGTVTTDDGTPVENARIKAYPTEADAVDEEKRDNYILASGVTDADGRYHLGDRVHTFQNPVKIVCMAPEGSDLQNDGKEVNLEIISNKKDPVWCVGTARGTVDFKLTKQ